MFARCLLLAMCVGLTCSKKKEAESPSPPTDETPHGQLLRLLQATSPANVTVSQSAANPQWLRIEMVGENDKCGWASEAMIRLLSGVRPGSYRKSVAGVPPWVLVQNSGGYLAARCDFLKRLSDAGFNGFECPNAGGGADSGGPWILRYVPRALRQSVQSL